MTKAHGYEMVARGEPLRARTWEVEPGPSGEVVLEVAGCGICHTDLGFLDDGVRTRAPLPLVLGHEISGRIVDASPDVAELVGQFVVVPAVLPCGTCEACKAGRTMICPKQVMPGNDRDGGFASHVALPARGLCPVPGAVDFDSPMGAAGLTLRHLAVLADAASTPYQALVRSQVGPGDVVVVVGLGGVGGYAAQLASALGAHTVGLDVSAEKLERATALGLELALDPSAFDGRALRKQIRAWCKERGLPTTRHKIFECSGTAPGQQTAWGLLNHGAILGVVGYTMARIEVRLSNLMAFDATAIGTWGCDPGLYPDLVKLALEGAIDLGSQTELRKLDDVQEALDDVRQHRTARRLVLVP